MRRFRRKPKVLWLPVHGTDFSEDSDIASANGLSGTLVVPANGHFATDAQPVTFDYTDNPAAEEGTDFRSLQDLASGNNYRLRRIVGKIFVGADFESNQLPAIPTLDIACGFMVNRTDDDGNLQRPNITNVAGWDAGPLAQNSAQDPWIWRRRWILTGAPQYMQADLSAAKTLLGGQAWFPQTNVYYGSVHDGPHIDQKTARSISNEERLFFWIQGRVTNGNSTNTNNGVILWSLDLRILASLRQNQGNRRNASR